MDDVALTKLLCSVLGTVEGWAWSDDPLIAYAPTDVGIFYGPIDPSPDRAVGVRLYDTADTFDVGGRRAQIRSRGEPHDRTGADALAAVYVPLLTGLSRHLGISGVAHTSFARLGADGSGRDERTDNFIITLDNEEAA